MRSRPTSSRWDATSGRAQPVRLVKVPEQATESAAGAISGREREVAELVLSGLTYKQIGEQLKLHGILPWLDEWELRPGLPWQPLLEKQIGKIKSAAVFVGKNGRGPWQDAELYAFLRQFAKRECPVIPVILPDGESAPDLPIFLEGMTWVDFRK